MYAKRGDKLTSADRETVLQNLSGLLLVANSTRAVTETVDEVLVSAKALKIASVTAKLRRLLSTDHVAGTGLL
jgi:hypothetical protein